MPAPHFNIKITQRSKGNSAVAGAAYQAGEKLFSEYDQKTKNYTFKKEVVYTEIVLPKNAPPEYADRATLWKSVEEIEKQWNSQLARRFVAALPREVPMEMLPQMVKEYCEEHFVSKGMCCDFAIHDPDPPGHNPHCHFMLTMRAIDENGKWLPKSRKVYDLDENGERIKLPSGRWKSHKEDTVDWNEQYHAEEWRHGWEIVQNKYEIFSPYFYDAKKNKAHSRVSTVMYFALFVLLIVGLLGGIFTFLSVKLCAPLASANLGWLYFALMGLIAVLLGALGSVFNTYAGLYLPKGNDLLLSMPIPVSSLMAARLFSVYLMELL